MIERPDIFLSMGMLLGCLKNAQERQRVIQSLETGEFNKDYLVFLRDELNKLLEESTINEANRRIHIRTD